MTEKLRKIVAQWMLDNYHLFTELLELAIFVHRRCSHLNWHCKHGHGNLSIDCQMKLNMLYPEEPDEILVLTFELWRHDRLRVSCVNMNDPEIDDVFGGCHLFDLLDEGDFIHFERCDMSDVPRAHTIIRKRLKEIVE